MLINAGYVKRHGFDPWVEKSPWRRSWSPTPVFLPGESHGQEPSRYTQTQTQTHTDTHTQTHTHTLEYCLVKKNDILPIVAIWMDLEGIMLSEISQKKTYTVKCQLYVESKKYKTSEYNKKEAESQIQRTN